MQPVRPVAVAPIAAVLLAACGALPIPPPSEIGGVPLTCVPATWERPPERVLGCGEAALVACGVLGPELPQLDRISFQHGPRCEPGLSEEAIRGLPPDLQVEELRRREAPCPALEPDLGLVRFTFQPVGGREFPESYVKVELTEDGDVAVASEMLPWSAPPLDCDRPGRP